LPGTFLSADHGETKDYKLRARMHENRLVSLEFGCLCSCARKLT